MVFPEKITKVFAKDFCAAISEKENLFIWGNFLEEVLAPHNPFKIQGDYSSNKIT